MLEKRVFLIDIDLITDKEFNLALKSDKEFMNIAERQGNVYSLEGYQKAFNAETVYPSTQYMRILDVEVNLPIDELTCPHCRAKGEPCDFPDLYYDGCGDDFVDSKDDWELQELYNEQAKLQLELQQLGYNIVTCGNCGDVFIHRT